MAVAEQHPALTADAVPSGREQASVWALMMRNRSVFWGGLLLVIIVLIAAIWPLFTDPPTDQNYTSRLKAPSAEFWFGTDKLGRDVFTRVVHGARAFRWW